MTTVGGRFGRRWRLPRGGAVLGGLAAAVLLLAAVVGAVVAVAVGGRTPTYRATTVLLLDAPRAVAESSDAGVIAKLSALRVKYVDLLSTVALAGQIADTSGVPAGRAAVFAVAPPADLLLYVAASAHDPTTAVRVSSAAADVVAAYARSDQQAAGVPVAQRYTLSVVTPATAAVKVAPSAGRAAAAGAIATLLTTAVAAAAAGLWWWRARPAGGGGDGAALHRELLRLDR